MNPEAQAWNQLRQQASAQLSPHFADRVLRAAREVAPSIARYFVLSAATVALCFGAIALFQSRTTAAADDHNLADWRQIASVAADSSLGQ